VPPCRHTRGHPALTSMPCRRPPQAAAPLLRQWRAQRAAEGDVAVLLTLSKAELRDMAQPQFAALQVGGCWGGSAGGVLWGRMARDTAGGGSLGSGRGLPWAQCLTELMRWIQRVVTPTLHPPGLPPPPPAGGGRQPGRPRRAPAGHGSCPAAAARAGGRPGAARPARAGLAAAHAAGRPGGVCGRLDGAAGGGGGGAGGGVGCRRAGGWVVQAARWVGGCSAGRWMGWHICACSPCFAGSVPRAAH